MTGHRDLAIVDLADENAQLREQLALTEAYREALKAAIEQLAGQRAEIEQQRRRIKALIDECRRQRPELAA